MDRTSRPIDVFGRAGLLARTLPGFEYRPEQERMMAAVEAAIAHSDVCLVEGGTGVGKTLAYLVPTLLSGRQTVVATGTRTLMDQIARNDVPFLEETLGVPFKSAVLKGRSNYVCLARLKVARDEVTLFDRGARRDLVRIRRWALATTTGDLAELTDLPEGADVLRRVACLPDSCEARRCPEYAKCFLYAARARAREADLVITNHHLFFADLGSADEAGGAILPPEATLVLDEAHGLEDVAAEFLGDSVSSLQVAILARDATTLASAADPTSGRALAEAAGLIGAGFQTVGALLAPRDGRFEVVVDPLSDAVRAAWHAIDIDLEAVAFEARTLAESIERETDLHLRAAAVRSSLAAVLSAEPAGRVRIVDRRGRTFALAALPIEVAAELRERVFLTARPVILASATLSVDGTTGFLRDRLGVPEGASETLLASPYDFERQVLLYLPTGMPDPGDPASPDAFAAEAARILEATGGRAFLLFTSHAAMQRAHERLSATLPFPTLLQGQAPRDELIRRFKAEPGTCLFATATFWEGVDVAGDALSCVIIDRLPFDVPDEPVSRARADAVTARGKNRFADYLLPLAVIRLRQGFGRLVRRRSDRGVVAVLDPRIRTRGYGKVFLRSLPAARRCSDYAELKDWCGANLAPVEVLSGGADQNL